MQPFPVSVPYVTTPHMQLWTGELLSQPCHSVTQHKVNELALRGSDLTASRRPDLVERVAEILGQPSTNCIKTLALGINEDIAIMHQGQLVAICFCFPSGWVPAAKLGQTLSQLHDPVADGDLLRRMSPRIAQTMAQNGPFRRSVWTVSTTSDLSNHPSVHRPMVTDRTGIEDFWFRTETQTTFALGDGESSGFLVLVQCRPLQEIWQNLEQRSQLLASLNSMTDAVVQYKHLESTRVRLQQLAML